MCALIQKPFGTLDAAMAHFDQYEAWATSIQRTDVEAWRDERDQLRRTCAILADAVDRIASYPTILDARDVDDVMREIAKQALEDGADGLALLGDA